ncbi:hypothetical protein HYFRA_00004226 [Hymenoscyphus fraxineus]|uniref:Uncharacterized protein n=1 Tax=Hymenoscyphus fraxineus TaxID=746836 RepID=A0A9N9PPX8_9HELO|nr:hypothetical protein HYFRA_00004226 [Hymenoscyphus fraxineus]
MDMDVDEADEELHLPFGPSFDLDLDDPGPCSRSIPVQSPPELTAVESGTRKLTTWCRSPVPVPNSHPWRDYYEVRSSSRGIGGLQGMKVGGPGPAETTNGAALDALGDEDGPVKGPDSMEARPTRLRLRPWP